MDSRGGSPTTQDLMDLGKDLKSLVDIGALLQSKLKEQLAHDGANLELKNQVNALDDVLQKLILMDKRSESQGQPYPIQKLEELLQAMRQKHKQDFELSERQIQTLKQSLKQSLKNLEQMYQENLIYLEQERDQIKRELKPKG